MTDNQEKKAISVKSLPPQKPHPKDLPLPEPEGVSALRDTLDLLEKTTESLDDLETKFAEIRAQVEEIKQERASWPSPIPPIETR